METVAAFQASFCSLSPNWTVRSGSSRSDLRVGSRPVLSNAWIQVTIFSLAVGLTEKIEVYLRIDKHNRYSSFVIGALGFWPRICCVVQFTSFIQESLFYIADFCWFIAAKTVNFSCEVGRQERGLFKQEAHGNQGF